MAPSDNMDLNSVPAYSARDQTPPPPYDDVLGEAQSDAAPLSEKALHIRKWLRQVLCTDYRIIAADHYRHHAAFLIPSKQKLAAISSMEYPTDFAARSELRRKVIDEELVTPAQELNLSRDILMPILSRYIAGGGDWYTGCIPRMDFKDIEDKVQVDLNIIVPAVISPEESELRANLESRMQHVKTTWSQEAARRAKFDPLVDEFGVCIQEPPEQPLEIREHLFKGKIERLCRDCPELAGLRFRESQEMAACISTTDERSGDNEEQLDHDRPGLQQPHKTPGSRRAALAKELDQRRLQCKEYFDRVDSYALETYALEKYLHMKDLGDGSQNAPIVDHASVTHASATVHVVEIEKTARKTSGPLRERKGGPRIQAPPPNSILKNGHTEQSGRRRMRLESYLDKLDSRAHIVQIEKTARETSKPPAEEQEQTKPDQRRGIFGRVLSSWNDLREPAQSRSGGPRTPPNPILKNGRPHRKR